MFIQHWKNRKNRFASGRSSPKRAIQEEASKWETRKLGKLRYQNYSCRLRRLGYRRVRLGILPGARRRMRIPSRRSSFAGNLGVNWIRYRRRLRRGPFRRSRSRALKEWRGPRPMFSPRCVLSLGRKRERQKGIQRRFDPPRMPGQPAPPAVDAIDLYQIHWPPDDNGPGP